MRLNIEHRANERALERVDEHIRSHPEDKGILKKWPSLVPLDSPTLPRLNLENIPGWAGNYARALAIATESPRELAAAMILATCSVAASRRIRLRVHADYFEPCNLWLTCALPPGNRKSAIQSSACAPLINWERDNALQLKPTIEAAESELKTNEARIKELRSKAAKTDDGDTASRLAQEVAQLEASSPEIPHPTQLWTSDATPERLGTLLAENEERLAWLSSEAGIFDMLQGRYSNGLGNLDLVLKAHSGDSERVDRGSRPPVFLEHPLLTIGLSPQPEALRGLASKPGFRGRGLLARFLYFVPPSPLGYRTLEPRPIPEDVKLAYDQGIQAMLAWKPDHDDEGRIVLHIVKLDEEAYREWRAFALTIEAKMRPGNELEMFTDWAGKAPGAAIRLAGVLHAIKYAHGKPWEHPLDKETMCSALDIMAVCAKHSIAALDLMGADSVLGAARHIWNWIERNRRPTFTVREAFEGLKGTFPRVADLKEALSVLEERGYVEIHVSSSDGPGRKPSPKVEVRPELREGWQ